MTSRGGSNTRDVEQVARVSFPIIHVAPPGGGHTSERMPSFSRGLWGDKGLARLEEEGELGAVEEGEEWWLCWIRSGRW